MQRKNTRLKNRKGRGTVTSSTKGNDLYRRKSKVPRGHDEGVTILGERESIFTAEIGKFTIVKDVKNFYSK